MSKIFAVHNANPVTRRAVLRDFLVAPVLRAYRALASGFTSIEGTELALWFHRCFFAGGLRYAGAG